MRIRFHGCIKIAALGCVAVLLAAGTARQLHTSVSPSHKYGKAVSEVSSALPDHLEQARLVLAWVELPRLGSQVECLPFR